jgi:hypothetical protein
MSVSKNIKQSNYWEKLEITPEDLQHLANYLFETEEPLTISELSKVLISYRQECIRKSEAARAAEAGKVYQPKNSYQLSDKLRFPEFDNQIGIITDIRESNNPSMEAFKVAKVEFEDGSVREFAIELASHAINKLDYSKKTSADESVDSIIKDHGKLLNLKLRNALDDQTDLIRIGDTWFPRSLLIDINAGHLNLAEAILDSVSGGPMHIEELMKQLELDKSPENSKLIAFSLNYALQEDPRFDEVGTTGQFSWFLRSLEPEEVLKTPLYLVADDPKTIDQELPEQFFNLLYELDDELSFTNEEINEAEPANSVSLTLSYPHWRAGSMPVTPSTNQVFPSALESENVKITFIDEQSQSTISAWLVRERNYLIGLREWYEEKNLIPGSVINITATSDPGIMMISPERKRTNKEWIKTVLVGADGGLVFALLRQAIYAGFNERMAIAIPDYAGLDAVWNARKAKAPTLKADVMRMMTELSKLNNQRHVHFVDLYAAINVIRRTTPMDLLEVLTSSDDFFHVGDNYFHITEKS